MAAEMDIPKIDQVAYYAGCGILAMKERLKPLGLTEWVDDHVIAEGRVFGMPVRNEADLSFNYQMGFEYELLYYWGSHRTHWHGVRSADRLGEVFLSHMGTHVPNIERAIAPWLQRGVLIAQEVLTKSHTNAYLIEKGRTYHYCVLETRALLGWDIKFIERIGG